MKTLIPTLLLAILVIGSAKAQDVSYASIAHEKKSSADYSTVRSELSEPFIKIKARTDKKIDELKDLVMSLILQNNISKQISDSTKKSSD